MDEHPFATYFDVHQGYRVLTNSHISCIAIVTQDIAPETAGRSVAPIFACRIQREAEQLRARNSTLARSPNLGRDRVPLWVVCLLLRRKVHFSGWFKGKPCGYFDTWTHMFSCWIVYTSTAHFRVSVVFWDTGRKMVLSRQSHSAGLLCSGPTSTNLVPLDAGGFLCD